MIVKNQKFRYITYTILIVFCLSYLLRNRSYWAIDSAIILIALLTLAISYKKFKFSKISYILMSIFFLFAAIGVYYGFSKVPLVTGIQNILELERNPWDRILHLLFGALFYYPFLEAFRNTSKIKKGIWLYFVPLAIIIAAGGLYEVGEWVGSSSMDTIQADLFIASQGDNWDAQKDLLMETIGAFLSLIIILIKKQKIKNNL